MIYTLLTFSEKLPPHPAFYARKSMSDIAFILLEIKDVFVIV